MDYIYTHNIKKYRPEISSEAHLEKYIIKNWIEFFNIDFLRTRKKISKKSVIDILAKKENVFIIIELKFRSLRKKDKKQLNRYIRDFSKDKLETVKGILIGYNRWTQEIEFS